MEQKFNFTFRCFSAAQLIKMAATKGRGKKAAGDSGAAAKGMPAICLNVLCLLFHFSKPLGERHRRDAHADTAYLQLPKLVMNWTC